MKLVYTKDATLFSKGVEFIRNKEYEVEDKVGEYLLKVFGDAFKLIKEPKASTKAASKTPSKTRKADPNKEG